MSSALSPLTNPVDRFPMLERHGKQCSSNRSLPLSQSGTLSNSPSSPVHKTNSAIHYLPVCHTRRAYTPADSASRKSLQGSTAGWSPSVGETRMLNSDTVSPQDVSRLDFVVVKGPHLDVLSGIVPIPIILLFGMVYPYSIHLLELPNACHRTRRCSRSVGPRHGAEFPEVIFHPSYMRPNLLTMFLYWSNQQCSKGMRG